MKTLPFTGTIVSTRIMKNSLCRLALTGVVGTNLLCVAQSYIIVDTAQTNCYNDSTAVAAPATGQSFYGQDAQLYGNQPAYRNNGDGTITDLNTGLMWVQARGSQVTWATAVANAPACTVGGYTDWRMPTMKELYSLVKFTGANGSSLTNSAGYIPFIDTNYFGFTFGGNSTTVGSRIIDAQDWSTNVYVSTVMGNQTGVFGFNFVDGRIKAYPPASSGKYVRYVRGNPSYGINSFTNNGDGTISDLTTGLMWPQNDSGVGMNWSNALVWVQARNATNYLGHNDWRLPNAKELHSLLDYTRSPATTASAAIFTNFNCTAITNEASQLDFPWYWTGTTMLVGPTTSSGVYICFGRAMAYNGNSWVDAHGAGAQRSDTKGGTLSGNPRYTYVYNGYYNAGSPQGDAVRIDNFVRPVRAGFASSLDSVGDGVPDWWRRQYFGGSGTTTNSTSCSTSDTDSDGMTLLQEYFADTNPTNNASRFTITEIAYQTNGVKLSWIGGVTVTQIVESCSSLASTGNAWTAIATNLPPTAVTNSTWKAETSTNEFYRLKAWR